jgi:Spy/CpxP family protein refolding chaperone
MKTPALLLTLALGCAAPLALASNLPAPSPYAGEQDRQITALSPDRIEGLLAGKGLGYARAAELNGIPGPMHVLELAEGLGLSAQQRQQTEALYAQMLAQAKTLGAELIAAEAALDDLFRSTRIDDARVMAQLQAIAGIQAHLRHTHLSAHLAQQKLLTPGQIQAYSALRGYHGHAPAHGHKPVHQGH